MIATSTTRTAPIPPVQILGALFASLEGELEVPNATPTPVRFTTVVQAGAIGLSTPGSSIVISHPGIYSFQAVVTWRGGATSHRQMHLVLTSAVDAGEQTLASTSVASTEDVAIARFNVASVAIARGDSILRLVCQQDSGGQSRSLGRLRRQR